MFEFGLPVRGPAVEAQHVLLHGGDWVGGTSAGESERVAIDEGGSAIGTGAMKGFAGDTIDGDDVVGVHGNDGNPVLASGLKEALGMAAAVFNDGDDGEAVAGEESEDVYTAGGSGSGVESEDDVGLLLEFEAVGHSGGDGKCVGPAGHEESGGGGWRRSVEGDGTSGLKYHGREGDSGDEWGDERVVWTEEDVVVLKIDTAADFDGFATGAGTEILGGPRGT